MPFLHDLKPENILLVQYILKNRSTRAWQGMLFSDAFFGMILANILPAQHTAVHGVHIAIIKIEQMSVQSISAW